jgi:hypothetical protein
MNWHPRGFGGDRPDPENIKREGWNSKGILVVKADDQRLSWPEQQMIRQLGEKLYGKKQSQGEQHD